MGRRRTYRRSSSVIKKSSLRAGNKLLSGLFTAAILAPVAVTEYACKGAEKGSNKQCQQNNNCNLHNYANDISSAWFIVGLILGLFTGGIGFIIWFIPVLTAKLKRNKSQKNATELTLNIKVGDDVALKSSGKRLKVLHIRDDNAFCTDGTSEGYLCYPLDDLELVIK